MQEPDLHEPDAHKPEDEPVQSRLLKAAFNGHLFSAGLASTTTPI